MGLTRLRSGGRRPNCPGVEELLIFTDPDSRVALRPSSGAGTATDYLTGIISTAAIDNASFLGPPPPLSLSLVNFCDLLSNLSVKNPTRPFGCVFVGRNFPVNELSAWTFFFQPDAIASVPRRNESKKGDRAVPSGAGEKNRTGDTECGK